MIMTRQRCALPCSFGLSFGRVILCYINKLYQRDGPEGFQRAIGKPFGRARRRETSAFDKATISNENSIILLWA